MGTDIIVSASRLNNTACMRKYHYSQNYQPMEKSDKLQRGSLFHSILETYYRSIQEGMDKSAAVELSIAKARDSYINMDLDIGICEWVIKSFRAYADVYQNDNWEILAVEEPFSKVMYEDDKYRVIYEGRVDLYVKDGGVSYPVDHKTTESFYTPVALNTQYQGTAWAFNTDKVLENQIGMQKTYTDEKRLKRYILNYDRSVVAEFAQWTAIKAIRLHQRIEENDLEPDFSQCRYCQFKKVCMTTPDNRQWILDTQFEKRTERYDLFGERND